MTRNIETKNIIEVEGQLIPTAPYERLPLSQAEVDEAIRIAELQVDLRRRLLKVLIKTTSWRNWADFSGKPYLDAGGANSFASTIGMKITIAVPSKRLCKDEASDYYVFETHGTFEYQGIAVTAYGACSSRDKFFAMSHGEWLPSKEVDETDIAKKAYTNCLNNGIKARLGLKSLDWQDLEDAGLDPNTISAVRFGKEPPKQTSTGAGQSNGSKDDSKADPKELREKIGEMLAEMTGGDMLKAADKLESLTKWTNREGKEIRGKRSLKDISDAAVPVVYKQIKKAYEEWKEGSKTDGSAKNS